MDRRSFLTALFGAPVAVKAAIANAGTRAAKAVATPLMSVPIARDWAVVQRYGDMSRFTDIVTTTLHTYKDEIESSVSKNNPLLHKIKQEQARR